MHATSNEIDDLTLARVKRGEPAACRALVLRYERMVFAVVGRILGPRGKASQVQDVCQETFLRVFRALPDFRAAGPARLSTWVVTIATRLAIDATRRRAHEPIDASGLDSPDANALAPDAAADRSAIARAIERAVEQLPAEHRAAFVLRAYHDFDYRQIADALDCELGTVKSRIARARAELRRTLEELAP